MEALTLAELKRWKAHHLWRSKISGLTEKQRHFHREAAACVGRRISLMRIRRTLRLPSSFNWESFCRAFRPE
jgi:hypothetical protein